MSLVSIWDFELIKGKKMSKKSLFLIEALNRMKNKNQYTEEEFEEVIDPFELILTLSEVAIDFDLKRGNDNGKSK